MSEEPVMPIPTREPPKLLSRLVKALAEHYDELSPQPPAGHEIPTSVTVQAIAFVKSKAAEARVAQKQRLESAETWRGGTNADWKAGKVLAERSEGRKFKPSPADSKAGRESNAQIDERIAAKHAREAEMYEQVEALLQKIADLQDFGHRWQQSAEFVGQKVVELEALLTARAQARARRTPRGAPRRHPTSRSPGPTPRP